MGRVFDPMLSAEVDALGADRYFTFDIIGQMGQWQRENAYTPALMQKQVEDYAKERQEFLSTLGMLQSSLQRVGVEPRALDPGTAEIGFLLPRTLFDNELEKLSAELKTLRDIIRPFSEIATGGAEEVIVRQISTSDPWFYVLLKPATVLAIGMAVSQGAHRSGSAGVVGQGADQAW
jgi:hypothetical protein